MLGAVPPQGRYHPIPKPSSSSVIQLKLLKSSSPPSPSSSGVWHFYQGLLRLSVTPHPTANKTTDQPLLQPLQMARLGTSPTVFSVNLGAMALGQALVARAGAPSRGWGLGGVLVAALPAFCNI